MTSDSKIHVFTEAAQLRSIADDWALLWEHGANATPFQHPDWVLPWADAFSPANLNVIEVRRGNALAGLAPVLIYPRNGEQVLALAAGGISDYLDILVKPAPNSEIVASIFEALSEIAGWTVLDFTDLPGYSPLQQCSVWHFRLPHDHVSSLQLPNSREELLQLLSKRHRANLRNGRSRMQKAGGGNVELATAETLSEFLDDLFRLHTTRWRHAGEAGVLADERVAAFHRESAPKLLARGILRLYRLRLQEQTIAVLYTLVSRGTVFCYLQGFDPEFAYFSPGTQIIFAVLEEAVQLGMRRFDFLRGREEYKRHWQAEPAYTHRIQLSRPAVAESAARTLVA